jgi:hypothetical protein
MVTLDSNCSQQDCLRAWRRHFKERTRLPLDLVAVAVLAAFGARQWLVDGASALSVAALALAGTLALITVRPLYRAADEPHRLCNGTIRNQATELIGTVTSGPPYPFDVLYRRVFKNWPY